MFRSTEPARFRAVDEWVIPRLMANDLKSLFRDLPVRSFSGDWKTAVGGINSDSRRVGPEALFFAIKGLHTDGNLFVQEAIGRGARAIVTEGPAGKIGNLSFLEVEDIRRVMAEVARRFFGNPEEDLELVGITGTNGKTTVSFLTRFLLREAQAEAGIIGTVKYDLGQRTIPASRTTPDPIEIHSMLDQMRKSGCGYGILEVSSHGIEQQRVDGIGFQVCAFLNLTRDHLEYHSSMERYFEVKRRLFNGGIGSAPEIAVINVDDPYGKRLIEDIPSEIRTIRIGEDASADLSAGDIELDDRGCRFTLRWPEGRKGVNAPLLGRFNVNNCLASFAICYALGFDLETLAAGLERFPGVPGRLERVEAGQPYNLLVDYAHTDDALSNVLTMLRTITKGRVLVVFGCGGDRDREKRPLMTRAVNKNCDRSWATSDNPRGESIAAIFADMRKGVVEEDRIEFVEDRRRAISLAIDQAEQGDSLLIAGKGHETFQEFGDSVVPFDDRMVARELVEAKGGVGS